MKKIFAGLFVAILLATGLVAFSSVASNAGGTDPYPGSVPTNCDGEALNSPRVGNPATVRFRAGSGGNGAPKGVVTFSYERKKNGVIVDEFSRQYDGPQWEKYAFTGIPKGNYTVNVHFNTKPADSVYKNCNTSFSQEIRPKKGNG